MLQTIFIIDNSSDDASHMRIFNRTQTLSTSQKWFKLTDEILLLQDLTPKLSVPWCITLQNSHTQQSYFWHNIFLHCYTFNQPKTHGGIIRIRHWSALWLLRPLVSTLWTQNMLFQTCFHDDVIKWKHFPLYWPFVWGIIPHTKASEAELWCFLWSASEQTVE